MKETKLIFSHSYDKILIVFQGKNLLPAVLHTHSVRVLPYNT